MGQNVFFFQTTTRPISDLDDIVLKTVDQTRSQSKSVAHPVFPGGVSRALTKVARERCHGCAIKGRSCRSSPSKSQKDYCSGNMLGGFRQLISTTYGNDI